MPTKSFTPGRLEIVAACGSSHPSRTRDWSGGRFLQEEARDTSNQGSTSRLNEYHLRHRADSESASTMSAFEPYLAPASRRRFRRCVRSLAVARWTLPVYFLASSFNAAMKKLEESLQLLQKNEDRLRFWGVERTDDPNVAGDLLREFGLWLDRRREFPRKVAEFRVPRERMVPAVALAPVRRILADSIAQETPDLPHRARRRLKFGRLKRRIRSISPAKAISICRGARLRRGYHNVVQGEPVTYEPGFRPGRVAPLDKPHTRPAPEKRSRKTEQRCESNSIFMLPAFENHTTCSPGSITTASGSTPTITIFSAATYVLSPDRR